jgi:hypothetical protein
MCVICRANRTNLGGEVGQDGVADRLGDKEHPGGESSDEVADGELHRVRRQPGNDGECGEHCALGARLGGPVLLRVSDEPLGLCFGVPGIEEPRPPHGVGPVLERPALARTEVLEDRGVERVALPEPVQRGHQGRGLKVPPRVRRAGSRGHGGYRWRRRRRRNR